MSLDKPTVGLVYFIHSPANNFTLDKAFFMDLSARSIGSTIQFVELGHCDLAYRVIGAGPALLLVHGYPLSGLTFRKLVPTLARHFTCYIPDLPGAGETRWTERTDFRFGSQAETLRRFVDALGISSYAILAHDTGGTIGRQLAIIDNRRVSAMVLIGTEIPGHRPPWIPFFQRVTNPNRPGAFKFLMRKRWFRRSSAAFGGCFKDLSLIDGEFFDLFLAPLLASDRRIIGNTRYLRGIDWDLLDSMKQGHASITVPVLLIWGEEDTVFPVAEARPMVHQFPDCRGFVTIPGARLFVQEEKPEEVTDIALGFLLHPESRNQGQPQPSHAS